MAVPTDFLFDWILKISSLELYPVLFTGAGNYHLTDVYDNENFKAICEDIRNLQVPFKEDFQLRFLPISFYLQSSNSLPNECSYESIPILRRSSCQHPLLTIYPQPTDQCFKVLSSLPEHTNWRVLMPTSLMRLQPTKWQLCHEKINEK